MTSLIAGFCLFLMILSAPAHAINHRRYDEGVSTEQWPPHGSAIEPFVPDTEKANAGKNKILHRSSQEFDQNTSGKKFIRMKQKNRGKCSFLRLIQFFPKKENVIPPESFLLPAIVLNFKRTQSNIRRLNLRHNNPF